MLRWTAFAIIFWFAICQQFALNNLVQVLLLKVWLRMWKYFSIWNTWLNEVLFCFFSLLTCDILFYISVSYLTISCTKIGTEFNGFRCSPNMVHLQCQACGGMNMNNSLFHMHLPFLLSHICHFFLYVFSVYLLFSPLLALQWNSVKLNIASMDVCLKYTIMWRFLLGSWDFWID